MKQRSLLATICAAGVISLSSMSSLAHADDHVITGGNQNNIVQGSDIDTSRGITMKVVRKGQNPFDQDQSNAPQLQGVQYELSLVNGVDITDNNVRKEVEEKYSYEYITENNLPMFISRTDVTNNKGEVVFKGLKPGLYVLKDKTNANIKPRVLMLPLVNASGEEFNYSDIIVMKNVKDTPPPPPSTETLPPPSTTTPVTPPETTKSQPPETTNLPLSTVPGAPGDPGAPNTPNTMNGPSVNTGGQIATVVGSGIIFMVIMFILFGGSGAVSGLFWKRKNATNLIEE